MWPTTGKTRRTSTGVGSMPHHQFSSMACSRAGTKSVNMPASPAHVHCRHSALVPVLLKDVYQAKGQFKKSKVALCIHNIA